MILLGRRISAADALSWGLVNRISPPNIGVVEDTLAFIEPITSGAPIAQASALAAISGSYDLSLAEGLDLELAQYEPCLKSEDRRTALEAFAQKKKPVFRGR
jgi:enoyl-CoA hydratase/carnithine racemase